jgi:glutathione peroxidase
MGAGPLSARAAEKGFHDFQVNAISGESVPLSRYKGKAVLVVNTASRCGYTPQYQGLQSIYHRYHEKGFEILAFPSNDFMSQEPGTGTEIKKFCETKYHVTFPLFEKNPVSGVAKQPLYAWMVKNEPKAKYGQSEVGWNFEKFLFSKDGELVKRYSRYYSTEAIAADWTRAVGCSTAPLIVTRCGL